MQLNKRPRHYAQELIDAKNDDERKGIFKCVPENFKQLVLLHFKTYEDKKKYRDKYNGTT